MIDINLIRENKELVRENIRKKFQDKKLPLVDEIEMLDQKFRDVKQKGDNLRALKNSKSAEIGTLMREGKREEAEKIKLEIAEYSSEMLLLEAEETRLSEEIKNKMMVIPNIIDSSVPIGKDDSENVEIEKFGEPVVPSYEIPYHADILESVCGLDKVSAGRTSGNGWSGEAAYKPHRARCHCMFN